MKVAIGSDHAGFILKEGLKEYITKEKIKYKDFGSYDENPIDYPEIGFKVAREVADGNYERGILICGTGIGMCIVANKVKDVRASLCEDLFSARYSREHNNTNILTMGAWKISLYLAKQIVRVWLGTSFGNEENHIRRIKKITQEEKYFSK